MEEITLLNGQSSALLTSSILPTTNSNTTNSSMTTHDTEDENDTIILPADASLCVLEKSSTILSPPTSNVEETILGPTGGAEERNNEIPPTSSKAFDIESYKESTTSNMLSELPPARAIDPVTVTMECPGDKVGAIIGKRGANVNEIMKRSGCRVVVDNSDMRDGFPKRVILHGPPDRLAVAMALVSLIIKDGANAVFPPLEGETFGASIHSIGSSHGYFSAGDEFPYDSNGGIVTTMESRCPFSKVGTLIGVKGQTIAEVMRRSGCRVHVIQDPPPDGNLNERQVVYTGSEEQIQHAKSLVSTVLNEGSGCLRPTSLFGGIGDPSKLTQLGISPTAIKEEDEIEPDKVGIVIGVKGSVISEVMRRSGCKVVINQDFPPGVPHKVIYMGEPEQIESARALVEAVLARGPAIVTDPNGATSPIVVEEMDIYQSQTGKILGPQGSTIKEIQVRCGVKMSIQVSAGAQAGDHMAINKLRLTGTVEGIQAAVESVCRVLNGGSMHGNSMNGHSANGSMYSGMNGSLLNVSSTSSSHSQGGGSLSPRMMSMMMNGNTNTNATSQQVPSRLIGVVMGLGADGAAGVLEPPQSLPDGMHQQTAEIKNEVMGKVIGKCSGNITLIKAKSGANVQVMKSSVVDRSGSTRLVIIGAPSDVHLATQMVQEVLVNGPAKLLLMPDKQQSVPSHYRGLPTPSTILRTGSGSSHGVSDNSTQFTQRSLPPPMGTSGYEMMMTMPTLTASGMPRGRGLDGSGSSTSIHSTNSPRFGGGSGSSTVTGLLSSSSSRHGASMGFGLAQPTVIGAHLEPLAGGSMSSNAAMLLGAPGIVLNDDGSRMAGGSAGNSHHGDNSDRLFASSMTSDVTNRSGGGGLTPQQFYSTSMASLKASDMIPQQYASHATYTTTTGGGGRGAGVGVGNGSNHDPTLSSNPFDYNIQSFPGTSQPQQSTAQYNPYY